MPALAVAAVAVVGGYALLTALRTTLATVVLHRVPTNAGACERTAGTAGRVTVLQAILSGDPTMAGNLRENLANNPDAHFVWLIDADDADGRRIATELTAQSVQPHSPGQQAQPAQPLLPRVDVVLTPQPPAGVNPKVFKLVRGFAMAGELVAVLDDDTVLPPGALAAAVTALDHGDLVTGIPVYRTTGGPWSRLVAAFVNGNALLTYLPVLMFGPPVTINGMFALTSSEVLRSLGGFAAIEDRLCDDYELAKLYRGAGLRIVQTGIFHPLTTTVAGCGAYLRLMRRWMVFANQLLTETLTASMLGLVLVPSVLPLVAVGLAVASAEPVALVVVAGTLAVKATGLAVLRRRLAGTSESPATVAAELVADLLLPLHAATSAVRPNQVVWRGRQLRFKAGGDLG